MYLKVQGTWEAERMSRMLRLLSDSGSEGGRWAADLSDRIDRQVEAEKASRGG